jgi:multiple sugar transport system substrate-binding protein
MQPIPASVSSEEVLLAAIAGQTTPDVCSNIWPGAMSEFTQAGGLVRLDQFADFDSIMRERVPEDLLETFRSRDGHFYQVPWKTNPIMMAYNIEMLRQAGIDHPPRTYSEYLDDARRTTRDINGDGQIDQWMGYRDIRPIWWQRLFDYYPFYIAASGGRTLMQDYQVAFGNGYSDEVFQFFKSCFMNGYYPITTFQGDAFLGGKLATQFTGPWIISYIESNKIGEFSYDFAPVPVPDSLLGEVYTYGDFKNIAIFSTTRHAKESWEFVKYLISSQSDLRLLEICSQIPIRRDLLVSPIYKEYFKSNSKMLRFAEQAPITRGVDAAPDLKEILDAISQEFEACAVYGAKSASAATHDAAKRASIIIQWNQ